MEFIIVVTLAIIAGFRVGNWFGVVVSARGALRLGAAETLRNSRHGSSSGSSSSRNRGLLARPKLYIVG